MPLYSLAGRSPALPPDGRYWVAPNASLIGDVRLSQDASVWFGAVLRGDNEPIVVGARSNIRNSACCIPIWDIRSRSARIAPSATAPCFMVALLERAH